LGNFPILAKSAAEIASGASNGKGERSGEKMIQRLFFYRIGMGSDNIGVIIGIEDSPDIPPYPAKTIPPWQDPATVRAEPATYFLTL
jgi:hypothetical protein